MLKKLRALTGKGLSTSEIGKKLGMSKNAVVGKLNRLGWNSKAGGAPTTEEKKSKKDVKSPVRGTVKKAPAKSVAKKIAATPKKAAVVAKKTAEDKKAPAPKKEVKKPAPRVSSSMNKTLAMHQRIIQHSLEMANLKPSQCRWPIGDPDSEHFHFCGEQVFVGKPYCYEHCKQAYQFTPPKKK